MTTMTVVGPHDGLLALVNLTVDHAYCEERCRRGYPWPRPEARPATESAAPRVHRGDDRALVRRRALADRPRRRLHHFAGQRRARRTSAGPDLHSWALAAITAYGEMPYRVRRRPAGAEHRARLSDELSLIKSEVDTCQVLLAADGNERLAAAYDRLYATARQTVGKEAHDAWTAPTIEDDSEMNQGALYRRLSC